jgi:stearoyl-CoA desaturase (delta-9 desaturase)
MPASEKSRKKHDWINIGFVLSAHVLALLAIGYLIFIRFSWWTVGLGFLWFALCGLAITGGYHRLFSHPTYKANRLLRAFYLFFGAASAQNSALKWSCDHRVHHAKTDTTADPYNIQQGFWWAHIGWVFFENEHVDLTVAPDLKADPLIRFQDRHYVLLAIVAGLILPGAFGLLWGDVIGALLVAGALRLVLQWHATFAVNSFAHAVGSRPFSERTSARDSLLVAVITLGEGYHNFHHAFPMDYRNGVRWYHLDPTKWFVWTMSKVGVTWDLRRTTRSRMDEARAKVARKAAETTA